MRLGALLLFQLIFQLIFQLMLVSCAGEIVTRRGDAEPPATDSSGSTVADGSGSTLADGSGSTSCNERETPFQGYCYQTTGLGSMTYEVARDLCTSAGAMPVSIHSAEENAFVYGLLFHMTNNAWIGLKRDSGAAGHVWEDGEALSYTNWQSGEPDNSDCTVMRGPLADQASQGQWADTSCSNTNREIVCKRRP